ncbi:Cytochrome P450 monooxygenase, partial [Rhizoctonia solani]
MNTDSTYLIPSSAALGALTLLASFNQLLFYVVPYLYDPYNYRKRFSGPPLAGLTNWWMSQVIRTGHHSETVQHLHEKYGTFVRLGPNHISIADPDALQIVYGHGGEVLKSEFYHIFRGYRKPNTFDALERDEHSKKRRRIANIFSPQNITAFEPRVRSHIRQICAQWDLRCEEAARGLSGVNWASRNGQAVMNICAQFAYLAFDIIGDLALGSPFGLIQAQKDSVLAIESVDESGKPVRGNIQVPVIKALARSGLANMSLGVFPHWTHKVLQMLPWNIKGSNDNINLFNIAIASLNAKIKRDHLKDPEDRDGVDLIDKLLETKNEDGSPLPLDELYAEALMLLVAGSDTTSNTLSSLCYYLAIHPEIQRELQAELDQHILYDSADKTSSTEGLILPPEDTIARYRDIKDLPYLNACIKEALRIHSTVGTGMPRVVPPGKSITVAGQTFKAGSVISVPSYTTNRSSVWGSDASEFRPGRWLEDNAQSLNKYFVPFSMGPRGCVGRNLANMDLLLIVATIFRRYEVEALPTTEMIIHEGFVRETVDCQVAIRRRTAP